MMISGKGRGDAMAEGRTAERVKVTQVVERYGRCLELVTMDPNFHEISVGLYFKAGVFNLWTYSQKPGVEERIGKIRSQLVALGGMDAVAGTQSQASFPCGQVHARPAKFLMMQAVEKAPDYTLPQGPVKDLRSPLMLDAVAAEEDGRWAYRVTAEGEAPNLDARLRAVTSGLIRYGEMEKAGDQSVSFPCGARHDELVKLVLPYARNISQVEDTLDAAALRGQMTTGTLGFTPPT
jgi:hypothetical protein